MLIVIDYGLGNIASVQNMAVRVGGRVKISRDPDDILNATHLILPGVGSFDHGVLQLHELGLFSVILEAVKKGIPILGICLGMQLLAKASEEGELSGLGLIDAKFKKFAFKEKSVIKVPHVGWNCIQIVRETPLFRDMQEGKRFYFTHSYYAAELNDDIVIALADYGHPFPAVIGHDNIFGVQFHPEKSHHFGMGLLKRFLEFSC